MDKEALDWFDTIEQQPRVGPTDIVIHLGTNNIDRCSPEQIVSMINELIEAASQSFPQAKVHVSEILPRKSAESNRKVEETNKRLWSQNMNLIRHQRITQQHLVDEKHLNYKYGDEDRTAMSGTMLLAKDIFTAILGRQISQRELLFARLRSSDLSSGTHYRDWYR